MHGGLSPELDFIAKINTITRPQDIGDEGLLVDLVWADPDDTAGWASNERGISYTFG